MPIRDHLKKILWHIITPVYPLFRDILRMVGYKPYPARQDYHIGWLNPKKTLEQFQKFLESLGFCKNKIAWIDDGEILSLRLKENFRYQYHVRLFNDNEIRGHYELTPEYSPLDHLRDLETTEKKEEFNKLLNGWLVENQKKTNPTPR